MSLQPRYFEYRTVTGQPVHMGQLTVTPESRALIVRLPWGGLVWHRPVAVLVERDGQLSRLPIVDVTRLAHGALLVLSALAVFLAFGNKGGKR